MFTHILTTEIEYRWKGNKDELTYRNGDFCRREREVCRFIDISQKRAPLDVSHIKGAIRFISIHSLEKEVHFLILLKQILLGTMKKIYKSHKTNHIT
jgi:hypothetical protein